ncbi:MAG TPA: RluA family pseudouridine synthase, partial [Blastocatellia bacterium]|nr:RluA family pseudouridine synthase [Blastocatellia bacterium]
LIGHPIVGDPIYASTVDPIATKHRLKHHLLHAARLVFRHPATGKEMNLEAALPKAMADLIPEL